MICRNKPLFERPVSLPVDYRFIKTVQPESRLFGEFAYLDIYVNTESRTIKYVSGYLAPSTYKPSEIIYGLRFNNGFKRPMTEIAKKLLAGEYDL